LLGGSASRAALLLASGAALLAVGCGSGRSHNQAELRLEREDLVQTARILTAVEPAVDREGQAAKAAWPYVLNGLPAGSNPAARRRIHEAALQSAALELPPIFSEERARGLTGPGSPIAATYSSFYHLATRGWRLLDYSLEQSEHGPPGAARFARENAALYIESVYDAQFALGQIGKRFLPGYEHLGGQLDFGPSLTQAEAEQIAHTYSEANFRLQPRATVKLGA